MSNVVVNIKACKNILNGSLKLQNDIINIKYAQNGTGKSTIGEALLHHVEGDLAVAANFQSFLTKETPSITISVENADGTYTTRNDLFKHIEVFNEDFVNNVVFRESQAITDSFNVFIKTPDYLSKKAILDEKLSELVKHLSTEESISELLNTLNVVSSKFSINKDGTLAKRGIFKDVLNPKNVYNLPKELARYQPFFLKDTRVSWITWKSQGYQFAKEDPLCPFCASSVEQETIQKDEEAFTNSYSKSVVKNQKELEDYIETLKPYISEDKYKLLWGYTRQIDNENDFHHEFKRFIDEVYLLLGKINEVTTFSTYGIKDKDLAVLEQRISSYIIKESIFLYFLSDKSREIYATISKKIESVLLKIGEIKAGTAALNKLVRECILKSNTDINEFLTLAGINYRFSLDSDAEDSSFAKLIYQGTRTDLAENANLRKCLSWGERNAISLVLFIYYANSKNADLIVLDDPISSFDKSKKFAIVDRLFKAPSEAKSLLKKTVLFLTHDFEPIIDLYIEKKFTNKLAVADYLINRNGTLEEQPISPKDEVKPITKLYYADVTNPDLNYICRFAAYRKYLEYVVEGYEHNLAYHFVSSLLKSRPAPIKKKGEPTSKLSDEEIADAIKQISLITRIPAGDLEYDKLVKNHFSKIAMIQALKNETRNYYRLVILRAICIIENCEINISDEVLRKYLNSSFHIENDYAYYLDYRVFDPIPPFVSEKMQNFIRDYV